MIRLGTLATCGAALAAMALAATARPARAAAQDVPRPVPAQVDRQLRQMTPDEIRARIRQAGLSEEDVRRRLREAGYSPDALDYYLSETRPEAAQPLEESQLRRVLADLRIPETPPTVRDTALYALPDSAIADSLRLLLDRADSLSRVLARRERRPLDVFGMSLFTAGRTEFQPVTMGPVPSNYRLGPGDEVVLVLSGDVQEVLTLEVTREGWIFIPNVGRVSVNGLTLGGLRDALYGYLGRVYSGVRRGPEATTHFDVSIGRLRRSQVFVIGEVRQPGAYEVTSVSTALHALYLAGGPAESGSFRRVAVRRGDKLAATLDLYEYLTEGAAKGDVPLEQGDVVFVPVREKRVTLEGSVVRPAIYELKQGEGLRALIRIAGGFEPAADVRRVQIDRILPPEQRAPGVFRRLLDVNVEELLRGDASAPIALEAGDRVTVYAVPAEQRDRVTLQGNVWKPGEYELGAGLTLWQLLERAGGLRDETYRGRAHIARLNKTDLTRRIIPVTLATASDGAPLDDPPLEEYDVVTVYAVSDFVPERFVSISGEVKDGGVFPYRERMTLRDLVLQAGGFTEGAYVAEAEVSRIVEDPATGRTRTEVLTVPLDSTYAVNEARAATPAGFDGLDGDGAAKAPEVHLERYDNVFIRRKPDWELQRNVVVTGEVVFPGRYSLEGKDERLASVLERAGGLTEQAYADGVRFFRREGNAGRVGLDLAAVLRDPRRGDNVILQPGDSIHIPEYTPTVRVEGAVLAPVSALYRRGAGLGHYVEQAGGYAPNADAGRVHVRHANGDVEKVGRFLFFRTSPTPDPGSVVIVPVKPDREPTNWGAVVRDVVSVGLMAATLIIAIDRN